MLELKTKKAFRSRFIYFTPNFQLINIKANLYQIFSLHECQNGYTLTANGKCRSKGEYSGFCCG